MKNSIGFRFLYGKLSVLFLLLPAIFTPALNAQEAFPYTLGANVETNLNTRENFTLGYGVSLDRYLGTPYVALGLRGAMSTDFKGITDTEANLYLRTYLVKIHDGGPFTQLGWGFTSFREDEKSALNMLIDFSIGCRFFFLKGFYAEPFIRTGFPFRFAIGASVGHWFDF